ncbi:peptidoglycan-binding protein [Kitasatospora phosalacinea]|uniref:peptidoglycan-binding protein n=1 Tax=Kitasatospora phosalacinea TaxID=2065 RepID=UPI0035D8F2BF
MRTGSAEGTAEIVDGAVGDRDAPGAPPRGQGLRRRRKLLYLVVAGTVLLSGAGLAAAAVVKSPAQVASEAEAPAPDVLTVAVERRTLTSTVVVRGQVTAGQSVDVAPVAGSSGDSGARTVVTKLPVKAGETLSAGQVLLEVSGRPVLALQGDLPVYRDLKPGMTGQDVKQLQQALAAQGFSSAGDASGTFGAATGRAVRAFYTAHGYDPLPAQQDGAEQISAAEDAVTAGERALADSRDALRRAQTAGAGQAAASAPPGGADDRGTVDAAKKQVERAGQDLARLREKLARVRAVNGPMVPSAEVVFLAGFPARVDSVTGRVGGAVSGKVLTVSAGTLVVRSSLSASDKGLVHPGQKVDVVSELTGLKATATVATVSDTPGTEAEQAGGAQQQGTGTQAGNGYQMLVQPDAPLDPKLVGQDVRLTVVAASSSGPVLVVPLSAVSATADGRTVVTVREGDRRRRVEVNPGAVGEGVVEIRPLTAGSVKEGDQVIVGVKDGAGPTQ